MCVFGVEFVNFDKLSDTQKKKLLNNYQKKKQAIQAQLKDANAALNGLNKAIKIIEKKSKSKSKRR
jgi:hypothetical protein